MVVRGALLIGMAAVAAAVPCSAAVLRVDAEATGTPIDGSTWDQAYRTLQAALDAAESGDEVWVVAGTYLPADDGDRAASFVLGEGVAVYGGFVSGAESRDERDPAATVTVLSGDLNQDDAPSGPDVRNVENMEENSYHVVRLNGGTAPAVLDGVTIRGGRADSSDLSEDASAAGILVSGGSLDLLDCVVENNQADTAGGGVLCTNGTVDVVNCEFRGNTAGTGGHVYAGPGGVAALSRVLMSEGWAPLGAAVYVTDGGQLEAVNSIFADNEAVMNGGGVYNLESTVELKYCTFSENVSSLSGGALFSYNATTTVTDSILWGDQPDEISDDPEGTLAVTSCIVSGGWTGGNLDSDPRFRLVAAPPFQLNWDSPAIDAATGGGVTEDFLGNPRPENGTPDIGAYEFGKDTDGGGLPDAYETSNGLDPDAPADDAADSDGDGLDNREEFRRGTDPQDDTDPSSAFYVDAENGNDAQGDGSSGAPWATIWYAMAHVPEGAATFPITINVEPGTYEEKVVLNPHVRLAGAGADTTIISHYDAAEDTHVVATAAEDTALRDCTLTFPESVTATAELLRIDNVAIEVTRVVFNGADSPHSIGVFVTRPGSSGSTIQYSIVKRAEYGVYAVDSGINVTRNLFEDLLEGAIFIRPPEDKQDGTDETPLLGTTDSAALTGFNQFRMDSGFFVRNMSSNTTMAEYNDWGVYTEAELSGRVLNSPGDVDLQPFISKSLVPGSLAVEVRDAESGAILPKSAGPAVRVDSAAMERDGVSGLFLTPALATGAHTCEVTARGYLTGQQTAQIASGELVAVTVSLEKRTGPGGTCLGGTLSGRAWPGGAAAANDALPFGLAVLVMAASAMRQRRRTQGE